MEYTPIATPERGSLPRESLRVLVADDQPEVLAALSLLLKGSGHAAVTVNSPQALLSAASTSHFDVLLVDLNYTRDTTSGREGLDLLEQLRALRIATPVIVMTAWSNVELAVEAMQRGASDFVQKPWDNQRLLTTLEAQARRASQARTQQRRAQTDIEIARNIQQKLLPQPTRHLRTLEYGGLCRPAMEVGGDYYDFLDLDASTLGFVLADIDGKGIGAALLMANLHALFRSHSAFDVHAPEQLLQWVNRSFLQATGGDHYATLFFGAYNDDSRTLTYINCGHHAPIHLTQAGVVSRLPATAMPLGLFADWRCSQAHVRLVPGDTLVIFSDGVIEAGIDTGEDFGPERLIDGVKARATNSPVQVTTAILDEVQQYAGTDGADDMTIVALRTK